MRSLLLTNYTEVTFLDRLRENLRRCTEFRFTVSFIKKAGLVLLKTDIEAALERGARGRIITSTYQNFTDIESLRTFQALATRFEGFACHLDHECFHGADYQALGFHSKGYLFTFDEDDAELLVGSSNITHYALLRNVEWDLALTGPCDSPAITQALCEFDALWDATSPLSDELIGQYAMRLNYAIERWDMDYDLERSPIKPNFMQRRALRELNRYRAMGVGRALVVAATGSGKTFLAAFDALNFDPGRLLFVAHEATILERAMQTFGQVFGNARTYGLYSGSSKDSMADFVFATNITMCKALGLFRPDEFDYIVVDECHHATAQTYRQIIGWFQPEFLLGLTATPERMDNADVMGLFEQNVPFELRLRDAIVNELVVPFHYWGIRDQLVDYSLEGKDERRLIAQIADAGHCEFVVGQIQKHRGPGKLKALAFCRNTTHARMMADALGEHYVTAYLGGGHSTGERLRAFKDLQDDREGTLEVLCCVNILNEGVDIPGVNMVLFLRPTESSTVFIQQLGRGLRRYPGKDHVEVLDFIGNGYKRSVQIAFALGSLSEGLVPEKRLLASMVRDDFRALGLEEAGVEVHMDDLAKEEVLRYIEQENFNAKRYLEQDFRNFRAYVNAPGYPSHMDYLNNDCAPDLLRFMNVRVGGRKPGSYYGFMRAIGVGGRADDGVGAGGRMAGAWGAGGAAGTAGALRAMGGAGAAGLELPVFSEEQEGFIIALSGMLPLVRPYEYLVVRALLDGPVSHSGVTDSVIAGMEELAGEGGAGAYAPEALEHALRYLKVVERDGEALRLTVDMEPELRAYVEDLLGYGLLRYAGELGDCTQRFKPWHSYRMDQVQALMGGNPGYTAVGTYYYGDDAGGAGGGDADGRIEGDGAYGGAGRCVVIFASLKKDLDDDSRLNYADRFLTADTFQWESMNNLPAAHLTRLTDGRPAYLFIRKMSEEHGLTLPFTYVGRGALGNARQGTGGRGTWMFDIRLECALPQELRYDFGVEG